MAEQKITKNYISLAQNIYWPLAKKKKKLLIGEVFQKANSLLTLSRPVLVNTLFTHVQHIHHLKPPSNCKVI